MGRETIKLCNNKRTGSENSMSESKGDILKRIKRDKCSGPCYGMLNSTRSAEISMGSSMT